ncbi:hypothetical protein [Aquimarina macrocephali]|uniref:hypothetical protein n=1 Tax=Aquimarina macrocephali TaxID=666563 RepID=UPI000463EB2A|nr:hypothetical protein [Aquimarina macrocephali]
MIEDELISIWQSSSNQERLKFEKSKLMLELQSSLGRLHRWWKYIERVNIISALITILAFMFIVYWAPYISMKIASVLVIVWSIYVGIRMSGVKKLKPSDLEENYLQYLEKTKVYLLAQKKMLETSLNWSILTIYLIVPLFFVGIWEKPLARYIGVGAFLALVGVGIYEYYLSKRRVKNEIIPRINRIDELIESLEE